MGVYYMINFEDYNFCIIVNVLDTYYLRIKIISYLS